MEMNIAGINAGVIRNNEEFLAVALKLNIKNIFAPGKLDEKDLNFYSINNILDLIKYL